MAEIEAKRFEIGSVKSGTTQDGTDLLVVELITPMGENKLGSVDVALDLKQAKILSGIIEEFEELIA